MGWFAVIKFLGKTSNRENFVKGVIPCKSMGKISDGNGGM